MFVESFAEKIRFTSARAETMKKADLLHTDPPVHLRTCGDNKATHFFQTELLGSPPHVRRQYAYPTFQDYHGRFTSARAETMHGYEQRGWMRTVHLRTCGDNFHWDALGFFRSAVHLRTCGDNFLPNNNGTFLYGSPPHVRRQLFAGKRRLFQIRFTSARAETMSLR